MQKSGLAITRQKDDYDVVTDDAVVGRIMKAARRADGHVVGVWTLAYGYREERTPTHGSAATREAAIAAFTKSWRRTLKSYRHFFLLHSSSASRSTAGASEVFILSPLGERPER